MLVRLMVNRGKLARSFMSHFDAGPPHVIAEAPGRVNLMGEHVDYCGGLVLPMAIDWGVSIAAAPSSENSIFIFNKQMSSGFVLPRAPFVEWARQVDVNERVRDRKDPCAGCPIETGRTGAIEDWMRYLIGVCAIHAQAGPPIPACRMYIDSDLPTGAGLSSSAALEAACGGVLVKLAGTELDPARLARQCRRAETEFACVPCGIMDQWTCMFARSGHALLIDCRDEAIEYIPWGRGDVVIAIVDSGLRRSLTDGFYANAVDETKHGLSILQRGNPSITTLRDVTPDQLEQSRRIVPESAFRRVHHFVSETARTRRAADGVRRSEWSVTGAMMSECHASLRDQLGVTTPDLDRGVELIQSSDGVFGARLVGGGFGGSIIALALREAIPALERRLHGCYDSRFDSENRLLVALPAGAARTIDWIQA